MSNPPCISKARAHLKETAVTLDDKDGRPQYVSLRAGPRAIGSLCGLGMELYFSFLKYTGTAFSLWGVCQIPMLVLCLKGSGTLDHADAGALVKTTAFNVGDWAIGTDPDATWDIQGFGEATVGKVFTAMGILDAIGMLLFMIIMGFFVYRTVPGRIREFDERNTTPSDFGVEINYLPQRLQEGHEQYEQKLKAHIQEVVKSARQLAKLEEANSEGFVTEISLVRDYKGCLMHFQGLKDLQEKLDNAHEKKDGPKKEKEILKLETKMTKLREKTKMPIMKAEERSVKRAFVMLDKCENKELLVNAYRFGAFTLTRMCQNKRLQFEGHKLSVKEAPEPLNLMWENQDRNEFVTFIRRCLSVLLTIVCFSISFALIFSSKIYTGDLQNSMDKCEIPEDMTKEQILELKLEKQKLGPLDECDCEAIGEVLVKATEALKEGDCKQWLADKLMITAFIILGAVAIVVINQVLRLAVVGLTKMERPLSVSQYYVSMAFKLFIAQWFNTALILLLVNWTIFNFIPGVPDGYSDITRNWYAHVGLAMVTTMIIQCFSPHVAQVATYPLLNCVRRLQSCTAQTQHDLNALYTYPDFQLAVRLAQVFNVMFCSLLFIAGVPLLSITAGLTCFCIYFCDKFILLRASKMPPQYDADVMLLVRNILPIGCFLHLTFAIYMLGNQEVFPSHHLIPSLSYENISSQSGVSLGGDNYLTRFFERGMSGAGIGCFLLWLLVVVFFASQIVKFVLGAAFGTIIKVILTACGCGGTEENFKRDDLEQNKRSSAVLKKGSVGRAVVFSYLVEFNATYEGLVKQANSGDAWAEKEKEKPSEPEDDVVPISTSNVSIKGADDEQQAENVANTTVDAENAKKPDEAEEV